MFRFIGVAMGAVIMLPGLVAAQEESLRDPAVGCYRIEVGTWTPELHEGNAKYQVPPSAFVLDSAIGKNAFERGKGMVRPTIPHGRTPSAFWERISADSIRLMWTNGFAGSRLRLFVAGDSLRGRVQAFTDVIGGPPDPTAEITGRRIPCSMLGSTG